MTSVTLETPSGKGKQDENFPVGSFLIRPDLRSHVHALYDFARQADDIADNPELTASVKLQRLNLMAAILQGSGEGGSLSAANLRTDLKECKVTAQHSLDLLTAFKQDAIKQRYASWDELYNYCRYSAMPVGRHVLDLHDEDRATWESSDALTASLQIINHLQDCGKDLKAMDRCYLPEDILTRHGSSVADVKGFMLSPGLRATIDEILDHVDRLNRVAEDLPRLVKDKRLKIETAMILALAKRLTKRLRYGDPAFDTRQVDQARFPSQPAREPEMVDLKAADLEVEEIVKRSGTSFYQGMRILPRERRMAMYGIYAFCRVVDDIADEPGSAEKKQAELQAWRNSIAQLYRGQPSEAITTVLSYAVADYGLRQEDFIAIIDGMETDAKIEVVAPSWDDLDLYCDQVASAVGRLSVRAFGDGSKRADDVAWALGRALQFTNILRDIKEDSERGRMYLPGGWLRDAGVKPTIAIRMVNDPNLSKVCERMAAQAHRYFKQAEGAMDDCDKKAMRPARMMAASYKAQLSAMEKRGWQHLEQPVKVPKWRKLAIALRYTIS